MIKWWRREEHSDTVARLEDVSLRLEQTTKDFRDRLQVTAPGLRTSREMDRDRKEDRR